MIPTQAIEKAIEGGWKPRWDMSPGEWTSTTLSKNLWTQIALDPTFWQALGRALGWKECKCGKPCMIQPDWYDNAHRFYDLILTGGDTEKFWADLLK